MLINFKYSSKKTANNIILFFKDITDLNGLEYFRENKVFTTKYNSHLRNLKINEIKTFDLSPQYKIICVKIENTASELQNEKTGASLFDFLKNNQITSAKFIDMNLSKLSKGNDNFIKEFLFGVKKKSFEFLKYKTSKEIKKIDLFFSKHIKQNFLNNNLKLNALLEGINLTKNLVSEPGNVLHPDEYVNRIKKLNKHGLKITILSKKKLQQLGMNALIGVGQGSVRGSYVAIIEWTGSNKKKQPLAFVGKGVCFDTGGISLKPAKFMEDMTYDMAGSAVVVGLMKTLALRKAKVNAVGVVGLVENMPDGNAQRPGDIVK